VDGSSEVSAMVDKWIGAAPSVTNEKPIDVL